MKVTLLRDNTGDIWAKEEHDDGFLSLGYAEITESREYIKKTWGIAAEVEVEL